MGTVQEYNPQDDSHSGGQGVSIIIRDATEILNDCHIGDSISCNGICLTVTEFDKDSFKVGISPETIARTNVASWQPGQKINLERAVSQEVRFGGHYVQGHIDSVASIVSIVPEGNSLVFGFQLRDAQYNKFIVEKGFVCIDGTSLTVTNVDDNGTFYIAMIRHTQEVVVMPLKKIGDLVNIEVDLTGKLIEKQITTALQNQFESKNSTLNKLIEKLIDQKVKEYLAK